MKLIAINILDGLFSIIWKAYIFFSRIVAYSLKIIGLILFTFWTLLSFLWPFSRLAPNINSFFRRLNSFLKPYSKRTAKAYERFLLNTDKSTIRKRIFSPILIVVLFLLIYPPSHWGPWKLTEQGIASYYGYGFYFRKTASGERYYPWDVTAASLTLPLGTIAKVVNRENGDTVYVKINDRGPYVKGRILDLSFMAALKLGIYRQGIVPVDIYTKN